MYKISYFKDIKIYLNDFLKMFIYDQTVYIMLYYMFYILNECLIMIKKNLFHFDNFIIFNDNYNYHLLPLFTV